MELFDKINRKGGFMDEIRCDESSYLIWKWNPSGVKTGKTVRENSIRYGSSLRVKDGEVAVFVYKQKDKKMQDFIVGSYDKIIKTKNFPILSSIIGLAYEGGTPFQAEIYFINLAKIIQVKFGVPFFDIYDPRFEDFGIPVAVRGTISFKITDYKEFIRLHRLNTFSLINLQNQIKDATIRYVKDVVTNAPCENNIPAIQIENKTVMITDKIEFDISQRMKEDFGITVSGVDIGTIEIDKSSEGYRRLMAVTKDITTTKIQAETFDYTERLRIQREEGQYAMHKQTQSANIGAFQMEKQSEVGIAGANALGQMGKNGSTDINLNSSNNSDGINMAAIMASMAIGGAAAYQYYVKGNEAEAARLADKGGKDAYMWFGRQLDNALGTDFFEGGMGVFHTGLSICVIGYSFYKTGSQILKDLKLDKIKVKSLFNGNKNKIKWGSHFNKENITKVFKNYFGFKNVQQKDVMKLRWKKVLGFKVGETLIKTPDRAKQLLQLKYIYKGGTKVYKTISKFYTNFSSGNYNPFTKTTSAVIEFYNDIVAVPSGGA